MDLTHLPLRSSAECHPHVSGNLTVSTALDATSRISQSVTAIVWVH